MTRQYIGVLLFRGLISGIAFVSIREMHGEPFNSLSAGLFILAVTVLASIEVSRWFFPDDTP